MTRTLCSLRAWLFSLLALTFTSIQAQKTPQQIEELRKQILANPKIESVQFSETRQTPSLIVFDGKNSTSKEQAATVLSTVINLRPGIDYLMPAGAVASMNNIQVLAFQQYFKGIKVDHAGFKVLAKDGNIVFANGAWYDVPSSLPTQASINEAQALGYAKQVVGASKYAWEQLQEMISKTNDLATKQALQKELNAVLPKGELVIVKNFGKSGVDEVRLAYKFNIYAAEPLSREWVYVDALNGKILLFDKIIKHIDDPNKKKTDPQPNTTSVNATVQTRYAGTQVIKTKQIVGSLPLNPALDPYLGTPIVSSHPTTEVYVPGASTYVLVDDTRGNGIETYDLNGVGGIPLNVGAVYSQGKSFTDVDNNWTYAEHHRSPTNDGAAEAENDDIAWDAHWGAEVVYDYWLAKHGRLSYDGNNAKILNFIHYGPAYDNAFWNGTAMTYGDGSGAASPIGFRALTSLDVCGHEIGHGVCSSTSDLVYAGESGAMNEGLSDIWASCIEHFAMTRPGSTVPSSAYRPFFIGEQISADPNSPLRRMDRPKDQSNPDTYGGTNWSDPNCTPNLANDECGVHTNSGVINHWFFLLTAGSLNGTRPAGMTLNQYYFPNSDDEINDLGNTYTVNGVGFDVSENVTFLMETMLTSTATYAEARTVSIQVATALSGDPCGSMVQSVTNAWYAVGVGGAFVSPCTTFYGFVNQPSFTISEQSVTNDCNKGITFNVPILIPANTTATINVSGTATNGKDYSISSTSYTNSTSFNQVQNVPVFIYDDAIVENTEAIQLSVTVPGQSNVNSSYTINITDNDVIPVIGSDSVLLVNETFDDPNTASPFNLSSTWTEYLQIPENGSDPTAPTGLNHWGLINGKLGITGKLVAGTNMPDGTYNNLAQSETVVHTTNKIDARGLSNLRIKFDYTVQGEVDVTSPPGDLNPDHFPKFDYMSIVYSFDGINWTELIQAPYTQFASILPASGVYSGTLPKALNNTQFYLGFRWFNDGNAGGPVSVGIDNLTLKGMPRKIENDLNNNHSEKINVSADAYFYSDQDEEIIGSVKSNASFDFGCTTASIEHTGNNVVLLYANNTIAQKVIRLTSANAGGSPQNYTIALYYTKQQVDALANATGIAPANFKMFRIAGSSYTDLGASNANATNVPLTYTALPNDAGGLFTASFDGTAAATSLTASYTIGAQTPNAALPVNCLDFKAVKVNNGINLLWKVSDEINNRQFEIERSIDGVNFSGVGIVTASSNNSGSYQFTDASISGLRNAYYRLKQVDLNGSYHYLCTVLFVSLDGKSVFNIGNIYPNPGKDNAVVNISSSEVRRLKVEYVTVSGQVFNWSNETVQAGASRIQLKVQPLAAGVYMIRFKDEEGRVLNVQQYIKQ